MSVSAHLGAVLGYFPFIVVVPAAVAVVCNRIAAAKRHPKLVYTVYGVLALVMAYLLSKLPGGTFKGIDMAAAGVLSALCFVVAYLRVTNFLTKQTSALLWRSSFLAKYPLYAATLFLAGNALIFGIYNYIHQPALLHSPIKFQIIGWLIPGIPSVLLINCCLYARRIARKDNSLAK